MIKINKFKRMEGRDLNQYLNFLENYTAQDNSYQWLKGVKYGIQNSDDNNYYISGNKRKIYPISKRLECIVYRSEYFKE